MDWLLAETKSSKQVPWHKEKRRKEFNSLRLFHVVESELQDLT